MHLFFKEKLGFFDGCLFALYVDVYFVTYLGVYRF